MLDDFDFPRRRYFHPTEAWERAWRRNLERAPRRRSPEESQRIKDAVYEWREMPSKQRPTLEKLGATFDPPVKKQYLSHLAHTLPPRIPLPPIRHTSSLQRQSEATVAVTSRPVLEGHGWNCECTGCRINIELEAAIKAAKGAE